MTDTEKPARPTHTNRATLERLAREALALAGAATEGPWEARYGTKALHIRGPNGEYIHEHGYGPRTLPDAEFIAHARQAVPALADALLALLEERDRLRESLTTAWSVIADAVSIGEVRYKEDFRLYSPWPELREAEEKVCKAMGDSHP